MKLSKLKNSRFKNLINKNLCDNLIKNVNYLYINKKLKNKLKTNLT